MRKIEEVLRLKWGHDLSNRQIVKSCLISHSTVRDYLDSLTGPLVGPNALNLSL